MQAGQVDYIIVGSGLTGSTIARLAHDRGHSVLVLERRSHMGGNVHDQFHVSGIKVHTYGPHYFRTSSQEIWGFVNRFSEFDFFEAVIKSPINGQFENWPIAASFIRRHVGEDWKPEFHGVPQNFEEAALSLMPRMVYEKFVKEYNEKQWGVPAHTLSADLCKRFDVRADDDPRLTPHAKHQGIPRRGYTAMMERMLDGIPVRLNVDFLKHRDEFKPKKCLIFTGPIDEFFDFEFGRLKYRGQKRAQEYLPDRDWVQPCGQINAPLHSNGAHIRTLEWKHMMPKAISQNIRGTVLTRETPFTPTEPTDYEYPFPDKQNAQVFLQYQEKLKTLSNVLVCGRLGEYRYYDMDQAIARAMTLAKKHLNL